ncbi:MAG: hypothetical protein OJF60_001414 [Burkholderiaceae bacterium]|jgi:uncharacterized protein (DUF1330 family)|nr:MAG: hypothetical protein OJF60_001414 [Burkholderiaceae bacterium]
MNPGYVIAYIDVTNPAQYEEYKKLSSAAMEQHGAQVCVRGGRTEPLEGDWNPTRVVVLKFASFERAKAFYHSSEYGRARQARAGAAVMNMIAVEGVA